MALTVEQTPVPGLLVLRLDVHEDSRGWFKESWQRAKMIALGLPDFGPVQHNVSFNTARGATRGIHAEPWDKLVSLATGRAHGAWVDLREGASFGATFEVELTSGVAVFVPRGVGNSYQTLVDETAYSYLVNAHWRPDADYTAVALDDPALGLSWPIALADAEISEKDHANPTLDRVTPARRPRPLILGGEGQLGRALQAEFPHALAIDLADLDLNDVDAVGAWPWHDHDLVLNAAGYTRVDAAETPEGRRAAWAANAQVPTTLAQVARDHRLILVHYSTDYVFDGSVEVHDETEVPSPLGVYAQSKAAGDLAVATTPRRYLIRTSWVIGDGANFVRTMATLAADGVSPRVVDDQHGRPTFTAELGRATRHLIDSGAAFGTYNVTNDGPVTTWAELARQVFVASGRDGSDVTSVTTEDYAAGTGAAPRPEHGTLSLAKLQATGFESATWPGALADYLRE